MNKISNFYGHFDRFYRETKNEIYVLQKKKNRLINGINFLKGEQNNDSFDITRFVGAQPIYLDVGGVYYTSSIETLTRFPGYLHTLFEKGVDNISEKNKFVDRDGNKRIFINRDGTTFRYVLNFLRDPERFKSHTLPSLSKELKEELKYEATFYGVDDPMYTVHFEEEEEWLFGINITGED